MRCYTIRTSRLQKACVSGMTLLPDGRLQAEEHRTGQFLFLPALDGVTQGALWGRLQLKYTLSDRSSLRVWAFASNQKEETEAFLLDTSTAPEKKYRLFEESGIGAFENQENILLYELKGRYLWIGMEIQTEKGGSIDAIRVLNPGDHFMQTFPDVYQERNSVFHRYLSIFSTLYSDFEEEAGRLETLFDIGQTREWMLSEIGALFGIKTGAGLLSTPRLREFLKAAPGFVHRKGTARVLKDITQLLTGEEPVLIEKEDRNAVLLLWKELEEEEELRVLFFLEQFRPADTRLTLLSYAEEAEWTDRYCFLDENAKLWEPVEGVLDEETVLDQCVIQ